MTALAFALWMLGWPWTWAKCFDGGKEHPIASVFIFLGIWIAVATLIYRMGP